MLVVITVAAATAFAFFVSAYEKQVLAEETLTHDVALEKIRITSLSLGGGGTVELWNNSTHYPFLVHATNYTYSQTVSATLVSGDVNSMYVDRATVNGNNLLDYVDSLCGYRNRTVCPQVLPLPPEESVSVVLYDNFPVQLQSPYQLSLFTTLGNVFTYTFIAPSAVIKTTVLPQGNYYEPLFDGTSSYQPTGGDNATISNYTWSFTPVTNVTEWSNVSGEAVSVDVPFAQAGSIGGDSDASSVAADSSSTGFVQSSGGRGYTELKETGPSSGAWRSLQLEGSMQIVAFHESGLPANLPWWVNITNGSSYNLTTRSTTQWDNVSLPLGNYSYTVQTSDKIYSAVPTNESLDVTNDTPQTNVTFTETTYPVTYTETGLAVGSSWTLAYCGIEADGTVHPCEASTPMTTSVVTIDLPNGTYRLWANITHTVPEPWHYYSPQAEVFQLSSAYGAFAYLVALTVTNTDGLSGTTTVVYQS